MDDASRPAAPRGRARARVVWALTSFVVVEYLVFGFAAFPIVLIWQQLLELHLFEGPVRLLFHGLGAVPSYVAFALLLMILSAAATRVMGWRTPPEAEMRIGDLEWPLLNWVRYVAASHLVRVFAGALFCGSPIWTWYLRLNGARIGRRVFVNTVFVSDHNLLELGDDVIVGADVHLSGHTVERGAVKTGRVRVADGVTIGLGSVIDIDVEIGPGCQVGALSLVPKHARLDADAVYVGIPVRRLER
jgi:acetyltransferase-like isoleucine patch superfamily enzyme